MGKLRRGMRKLRGAEVYYYHLVIVHGSLKICCERAVLTDLCTILHRQPYRTVSFDKKNMCSRKVIALSHAWPLPPITSAIFRSVLRKFVTCGARAWRYRNSLASGAAVIRRKSE